jgi:PAS domain S-box-containing protein
MKILDQEKMERIKVLLKTHPRGLSITNLASITGQNRNLIAKYLDMLVISGQVEIQQYGPAKVYFPSQRIPVSAMIEITSDLVMVLDQGRKIVHVNEPFARFLGLTRDRLLGKTIGEVGHPFLAKVPLSSPSGPMDPGDGGIGEVRYPDEEGGSSFRIKRAPAVFEDGSVGITLIIEDITSQRKYEENLLLSEARYRGIVQDQTEFITRYLPDTTITFVNDALSRYVNRPPEELLGRRFIDMIPEEERTQVLRGIGALSPQNPTAMVEHRIADGRGELRWVNWTNRAIFDDGGSIREYQGMGRDVTEQREIAEKVSRYILQLEFISRKALEFVHATPEDDLYLIIARGVKSLYPDAKILVHSYDRKAGGMRVEAVLDEDFRARVREIMGQDPVGIRFRPSGENEAMAKDGTLHRIQGQTYAGWMRGTVPEELLPRLQESIGSSDIHLMGLTRVKELYGEVLILVSEGTTLQPPHLLETYLNQASVAVQRRVFHQDLRRTQEQYRRIVENASVGIWVLDRDYRTTFVNARLAEMLGHTSEEMYGTQIEDFMLPEDIPAHHLRVIERRTGVSGRFEQRFLRKDGSLIWASASATPLMEGGEFAGAFAMLTDITEQKRAENALRESEGKYRALIESTSDFIWEMDAQGRYTYCSPQMEILWGLKPEQMLGKTPFDMMPPEDRGRTAEIFTSTTKIPRSFSGLESMSLVAPGRLVHVETSGVPFFDGDGNLLGFRGITRDITERKRADQALRESEEKYRALVEQANDGIVVVVDGVVQFCNPKIAEMWGGDVKEIVGQPYEHFIDPREFPRVRENYERRMQGLAVSQLYNTLLVRRDGGLIHADLSAETITYEGKPADLIVVRDTTEKRKAEEELKKTHDLQQAILTASPVGIGVATNRTLTWANRAMDRMLGYEPGEMKGHPSQFLFADNDEYQRAVQELYGGLENKGLGEVETVWKRKDGSLLDIFLTMTRVGPDSPEMVAVAADITERKIAEQKIRRSEELFRTMVSINPIPLSLIDTAGKYLYLNPAFTKLFGYTLADIPDGKAWFNLAFPDEGTRAEAIRLWKADAAEHPAGEVRPRTFRVRCRDGSWKEILFLPASTPAGLQVVVYQDLTLENLQGRLRDSEDRYRHLVEDLNIGIYRSSGDPAGRFIWGNTGLVSLLGYENLADLQGVPIRELFIRPEGRRALLEELQEKRFVKNRLFRLRRKDGTPVTVSVTALAEFDEKGKLQYITGLVQEISETGQASVTRE